MPNNVMKLSMKLTVAMMFIAPLMSNAATVGELSRIQSETLIIKAKASRESAQAEMNSKRRESNLNLTGGIVSSNEGNIPVVKNVIGQVASLLYADGSTRDALLGDSLPGGFKVTKVNIDKVEITAGKKVVLLGFSSIPPTNSTLSGGISQPMMPNLIGR